MNKNDLILGGHIPLDKSWMMRMGFMDMLHDMTDTIEMLGVGVDDAGLCNDLKALVAASSAWMAGMKHIPVGESGTLYRFLRFASWKLNRNTQLHKEKTLITRPMCDDPNIVNLSVNELMTIDNHTSQWASAAVLMGSTDKPMDIPCKLKVTFEARNHWLKRRLSGRCWDIRFDETLAGQAAAFIKALQNGSVKYTPHYAEEYPFARAFDLVTPGEAGKAWPSLAGHESNRITAMEEALKEYDYNQTITSSDHRIVQAIAMKGAVEGRELRFGDSGCVAKSWPGFWQFLDFATALN